jgi:phage replication O-like protein O
VANVQPENGYTRIAHPVLEALARSRLPARHLRVVLAVARLTWGWGKKGDGIGSRQLGEATDTSPGYVRRVLADLLRWGVLQQTGPSFRGRRQLGIVKDFEVWCIPTASPGDSEGGEVRNKMRTSEVRNMARTSTPEVRNKMRAEVRTKMRDSKESKESVLILPRRSPPPDSEVRNKMRTSTPPPGDASRLAELLRTEILRTHPKARVPANGKLGPWTKTVDLMLRRDERSPVEVEAAIGWLFGANLRAEVSFVVLSASALREKFDRVQVQMTRPHGSRRGSGPRVPEGTWRREG